MLDMRLLSLPLLLLFGAPCHGDAPRFGNQFQSHMVLQRDAPLSLWGFDAGVNETLRVCLGARCVHTQCAGDGTWRVGTIEPQRASVTPRDLWVIRERDGQGTLLEDIVFGDVFIFSGQSNIDIPEAYGHQVAPLRADPSQSGEAAQLAEEQLAETLGASGMLRMRIVDVFDDASPRWNATEGQPELTATPDCARCPPPFAIGNYSWCQCSQMAWTRPDAVTVRGFSATSWFTAVALRKIVPALHDDVPIGIVKSSKGGSTIDLWSSEDARRQCKPPGPPPPPCAAPALCPGSLWSQMMAPLAGLKFKAVTWYQGENNLGAAFPYYDCALKAMIPDWREKLQLSASTPFVVVQLQPWCTAVKYCDDSTTITSPPTDLAEMRLAQASAAAALPNVSLVSAMDLGSLHSQAGSCHSAQKPELGARLALALKAAVYDRQTVWASPAARRVTKMAGGGVAVDLTAPGGRGLALNTSVRCPAEISPLFCTGVGFELCSGSAATAAGNTGSSRCVPAEAVLANSTRVVLHASAAVGGQMAAQEVTRVRYAFADWPLVLLRDAATGLPALPFDLEIVAGAGAA